MTSVLVTGAAGFIGAHAAAALARAGHRVVGCDSFNAYYDPRLKHARVAALLAPLGVAVAALDLSDVPATQDFFARQRCEVVLHLAAQAGVRHSVQRPLDYATANLMGFASVLEACRHSGVAHLLHASSSSVYGQRTNAPFREQDATDAPASFYAATKKANELMAHASAAVHGLPATALRFFTVYGPWGRPDMAYWGFAEAIQAGRPITLYGDGLLQRDFTCIDDVVDALLRLVRRGPPVPDAGGVPWEVFNVGHRQPVRVIDFVGQLEAALGRRAVVAFAPRPPGDVALTCADPARLEAAIGPWAATPLADGLPRFVHWLHAWKGWDAAPAPASAPTALPAQAALITA
ncbi:NAD-dependent epimerase/dehydratase family protein [uncultured Pseudacidovorax sp.]|uniref:NAD-dependent epimerase/dehydratase family protein n=1 Tax=uncultured Pseudacidovorax sp. TaxID=679313 RepID=UPI0025E35F77|nr:NAD-dependent epimerase/dehydratase family protein [uncultured Pseudacidovorax sp.]